MKYFFIAIAICASSFANAKPLDVSLRDSFVFDRWCANQTGIAITPLERQRLENIIPKLQFEWNSHGPELIEKMEFVVKKPFPAKEMIATVFLCKKTPSMSMPLLINGNWFVKENPEPIGLVVDIVFHELIHTYLVDNFPGLWYTSPLLAKYKNEERGVLSHLHLMALQKRVYLELGLKDRLQSVIKFDSEVYQGAYKRSWEIVNLEGEGKFIEELK